ncbi:MAG TPA: DUF5703 family protein [Pseudonocardiaceae bacterium]|jgi:hypothetical protein
MSDGSVVEDWEYQRLRLPGAVSRRNAATVLALQAEFAGWELSGVRLYSDGTRKVMLRRRRGSGQLPGLSI